MASHDTAEAIVAAAIPLFSQRGFDGVSTREICAAAGVSANGLHYHFGSKQALYESILERFASPQSERVARLTAAACRDGLDLTVRMRMLAEEILDAYLSDPDLVHIAFVDFERGEAGPRFAEENADIMRRLSAFLAREQAAGLLRASLDVEILAGMFFERLYTQVRHLSRLQALFATTVRDPVYRDHWLGQLIEVLFFGALAPGSALGSGFVPEPGAAKAEVPVASKGELAPKTAGKKTATKKTATKKTATKKRTDKTR